MKYLLFIIIIVLTILQLFFTSAETIDFSCPDIVSINEEFTCTIKITEGTGIYDVKLNIVDIDSKSIIRVLHEETWKSGFYYLKEFVGVNEQTEIKVKGEVAGIYESVVKIRKGSFQESFPFTISFGESESYLEEENEEITKENNDLEDDGVMANELLKESIKNEQESIKETKKIIPQIISLNDGVKILEKENESQELIYESKNSKILNSASYAFSIFLVIIIGFLLWERF